MGSRRDLIKMTDEDAFIFLKSQTFGVVGTTGPDGSPHMVHVGYLLTDRREIAFTSFAAAQKIKNVERTGFARFLVEITEPYDQVRGVLIGGRATIDRDIAAVIAATKTIEQSHQDMRETPNANPDFDIERRAPKRVVVRIEPEQIVSWDHRRLGGTY